MLLHTFTNILVKKLFGNNLVGRFSYVSLTIGPRPTPPKILWKIN